MAKRRLAHAHRAMPLETPTAGNVDLLTRYPMVTVGKERRDYRAHILRDTRATEGCLGCDEGFHFRNIAECSAAEVSLESARGNHVDVDLSSTQLFGEESGQHLGRSLGGTVDGVTRKGDTREPARDIHDAAAIRDQRQKFLGEKKTPLK